jgi:hypothetical protein
VQVGSALHEAAQDSFVQPVQSEISLKYEPEYTENGHVYPVLHFTVSNSYFTLIECVLPV